MRGAGTTFVKSSLICDGACALNSGHDLVPMVHACVREREIAKKVEENRIEREINPRSRKRDPKLNVDDVIRKALDRGNGLRDDYVA